MTLTRPRQIILAVAVVAAGLTFGLWPRSNPSPRERVLRTVVKMTAAAEQRDVPEVMAHVSERFRSEGGWDKREAKAVVAQQVLAGRWVRIFTTDLEVSITSETTAEVKGKFIFGRSEAKKLEDLAKDSVMSAYAIEGKLEKESDGEWRFVSANHRPLEPGGLF